MSEVMSAQVNRTNIRWQLLATVSAIALIGAIYGAGKVKAEEDDNRRPQVWIELGGQLSHLNSSQEAFAPDFPNSPARPSAFSPSQPFERPPLYSIDESGKISFEPEGSSWELSVSARYGRSKGSKQQRQQTNPAAFIPTQYGLPIPSFGPEAPLAVRFADTDAQNSARHLVADFQAGKDVGLGLFGSSVLDFGIRFAQFNNESNISLKSDPDWHFYPITINGIHFVRFQVYHSNAASLQATRSFHGVGPSLSWTASTPLVDISQDSKLSFDWGVNGAILFGRQKAHTQHQTTGRYLPNKYRGRAFVTQHTAPPAADRAHTVTVPNVGGFAGLSFRYSNAKFSLGYRADFFLGAMDGGIDVRRTEDVGFHGPFATVSIGLGG